jgi:hypothetical protein
VAYGDYEDPNRPDYYDPYAPVPPPEPSGPVTPPPTPGAPTPPPATPPPATTPPATFSLQAMDAILRKYPPTNDGIAKGVEEINKTFGTSIYIVPHPTKSDKLANIPGFSNQIYDAIVGAGGPNPSWGGGFEGLGGDQRTPPVDLSQVSIDPSYLERFEGAAPNFREQPNFMAPGAFTGLSESELYADPSYKFRVGQGAGAIENSAAARGVLNSGGTLYDILNFGQKAGSQEYGAQWDRKFNTWNADWNNAMSRFSADKSAVDTGNQNLWMRYLDAQNLHFRNQSEPFSKLIQAANLGVGAAR